MKRNKSWSFTTKKFAGGIQAQCSTSTFCGSGSRRKRRAGRYVEDLKPEIQALGPMLGELLRQRIVALAGGGDRQKPMAKRR